ncbi:MAG: hypothetical protein ACOY0T_13915 [Myxococcota bacterium]
MWLRLISFALVLLVSSSALAEPLRLSFLFEWRHSTMRTDYAGMLGLELPLERMVQSTSRAEAARSELQLAALTEGTAPAARVVTPRSQSRPLPARSVRRLLRAALAGNAEESAEERLASLASRSRVAAVLPELSLRAARSTNESLRLSPNGTYVYDYTQTGGAGLIFEARATWKLDRLVFTDDELHVERLRVQREKVREHVIALLLKHLFAWQRARARLLSESSPPEDEERVLLEAELDSERAALDVLTDGAFSEELPRIQAISSP